MKTNHPTASVEKVSTHRKITEYVHTKCVDRGRTEKKIYQRGISSSQIGLIVLQSKNT